MKPWLLPSLCVAVVLMTLAGCSYPEPKFRTGPKPPPIRTQQQIADDVLKVNADLDTVLRGVNDAAGAKDAILKIHELSDRLKALAVEGVLAQKRATPAENDRFNSQYEERMEQVSKSSYAAGVELAKKPGLSRDTLLEVIAAVKEGGENAQKAVAEAMNQPPPPPPEFMADTAPDSSCWAVWLLCLLVLATCIGFLFRDGLWSNALGLVNVVFAGLLAMNFHEWLANYMMNYADDVHSYVSFLDFLALWTCFVVFAIVFRAATDAISRVRVRFLKIVDLWGGVALSLCIGWVMVGFTLASLHTAPLAQYPLFGSFQPQSNMFFGMLAPDREWLGFTKYESEGPFRRSVDDAHVEQCFFPPNKVDDRNFITKHLERRQHIENYILGNPEHAVLLHKL
jgi:hypothetical protein